MNRLQWALVITLLVAADQAVKYWVSSTMPFHQLVDVLPFLGFYFTYNEGIAFSFLSSVGAEVLIVLTLVVTAFVLWLWRNLEEGRWLSALGYALVISGALGNLVDRILLGKVVDYILFHVGNWSFAVFNLADSFISVGAAAIVLDEILIWHCDRTGKTGIDTDN